MRFAHMADCHVGGWQDPRMKALTIEAFSRAIVECISRQVDFLLISGDLFNTALPQIDLIKEVAASLKKINDNGIKVYIIAGSHDFSPSRKTMLDVLEKAGLCTNVMKVDGDCLQFTTDQKTGAKITGILGKSGGLEKEDYECLDMSKLESEQGFKIFMFHTALEEFKPVGMENMGAQSVACLPKNFDYYAGGHVHYIFEKRTDSSLLTYPGALFPNNFKELEEFKGGGFYVVDDKLGCDYVPVEVKPVLSFVFSADGKTAQQLAEEISSAIAGSDIADKIVTLRVSGELASGSPSDVNFKSLMEAMSGAYFIMKNISKLSSKDSAQLKLVEAASVEEVESKVIEEHASCSKPAPIKMDDPERFMQLLFGVLDKEKADGEKNADFESRIITDVSKVLRLDEN